MTHDVVIIGGGAAGLAGAVALGRALRTVLVIDGGEPRNAPAAGVHNYLTRDGMPPAELAAAGRAEAEHYGAEFRTGQVREVTGAIGDFRVALADGSEARARRIIVASGVRDVLPDIPGVAERWGGTVLHCPYCHGWEARGTRIGVIATAGPAMSAMKGLLWSQWTDDLLLFLNDSFDPDAEQARQFGVRGVRTVAGKVEAVTDAGVRLADGTVVARDHLVVASRVEARVDFLAPLGLKPVEHPMGVGTHLPVEDDMGRTSVPGVWAAGNVKDPAAVVISSATAGLAAAAAINMELIQADVA
ncbi:NAD(P)/FAD-dependent oxidoreductase [Actinoplanes sp. NPDC049265]|uniref:NAD(P)/FAD-dependent oxidoreductase n=1 Tax=Actinoplanes sp. NPDC049265 TaxID=3363902 RepID=UPI0037208999